MVSRMSRRDFRMAFPVTSAFTNAGFLREKEVFVVSGTMKTVGFEEEGLMREIFTVTMIRFRPIV